MEIKESRMSSNKEERKSADKSLTNSENETPNDCAINTESSFPSHNIISQVESDQLTKESGTAISPKHAAPQAAKNSELEVENTIKDVQEEELREEASDLIQIPIPKKWFCLMSGFKKTNCENKPVGNNNINKCSIKRGQHNLGKVEMKARNFFHNSTSYESSERFSIPWKIPFFKSHEIRRMILRLFCGSYFHRIAGSQNSSHLKQKYMAVIPRLSVPTSNERALIFGMPFRVIYNYMLLERMAIIKSYRSFCTKGKEEVLIFPRLVLYVTWVQVQQVLRGKIFEDHSQSSHSVRVVIISTNNSWEFICPTCGRSFNSINEFREHSCCFPQN